MPNRNVKTASYKGKEEDVAPETGMMEVDVVSNFSSVPPQAGDLSVLPVEMLGHIGSFLNNKSKARLSLTSRRFHQCFKDNLEKAAIETLNTHVLRGADSEALSMIASCPERLCAKGKAVDYAGRSFNATPFQAALLAHKVGLWKKMEPMFDVLPGGQAEKARQFKEIFPNGLPSLEPYDFSALVQAITNASPADIQAARKKESNNTPLWQALETFRKEFTDLAMKETWFNPQHLIKAFNLYDQQFTPWSVEKLSLFWCQVIGYSQRFLPEPYVRKLYRGVEGDFFSLQPSSGLGFDFGVYSDYTMAAYGRTAEASRMRQPRAPRRTWTGRAVVEELCRANTSELLGLERCVQRVGQPVTDSDTLTSRSCCTIS